MHFLAGHRVAVRQAASLPLLPSNQHHHPGNRSPLHNLQHLLGQPHHPRLLRLSRRVPVRNLYRRHLVRARAPKVPGLVRLVSLADRQAGPHALGVHQLRHGLEVDALVVLHLERPRPHLLLLPHGGDKL